MAWNTRAVVCATLHIPIDDEAWDGFLKLLENYPLEDEPEKEAVGPAALRQAVGD